MLLSRFRSQAARGFTLIELLVVVVIIGILATIAISRFTEAQNQARIAAARSGLDQFRQVLAMYEYEHAHYPTAMTLATVPTVLIDSHGDPFMTLPTDSNFVPNSFDYNYVPGNPSSYRLTVRACDADRTVLIGTPDDVAQCFSGAKGRAKVDAAYSDLEEFWQVLHCYGGDYADFPAAMTLATVSDVLVDPNGNLYETLRTDNFAPGTFTYEYVLGGGKSYKLTVRSLDNGGTILVVTDEDYVQRFFGGWR